MRQYIVYLLELEKSTRSRFGGCIRFDRTGDNAIVVSCEGYQHNDLNEAEKALLGMGCRYDFKKGIQKFDKISGRTYTYFIEPKNNRGVKS